MATQFTGISKQQQTIRQNVFIWCMIFLALFLVMIVRLGWLQLARFHHYNAIGERYRNRNIVLPAARGRLLDTNYAVLALDDQRESLYVDPSLCTFPGESVDSPQSCAQYVAELLAPIIQRPIPDILASLRREVTFVWVKRNLAPENIAAIRALALPGLQVREDGGRYRISVDRRHAPPVDSIAAPLARILNLTEAEVSTQLGGADASATAPPPGIRWVRGVYTDEVKDAVAALNYPGIAFTRVGSNYSLGVDPRRYTSGASTISAESAAATLAPLLGMTSRVVEQKLMQRSRFSWIKRGLSEEMSEGVNLLQSTLYVVDPGKVLEPEEPGSDPQAQLADTVERLYGMLNEFDNRKRLLKERISHAEIRRCLSPGATPGPMCVRMDNGRPAKAIIRRLYAKPIPGVMYGLPGIDTQRERRRRYPFNTMAAASLGFIGITDSGMFGAFGLEQSQNDILHGVDGREVKEIDGRQMTIPERSERNEPVDGRDVVLTLNLDIQLTAEEALAEAVTSSRAIGGQCVVLDPDTGEILALATQPTWDANAPGKTKVNLVNAAISHFYEPGSTFKVVPVMAALEEGLVRDKQKFIHCSGALSVGRRTIHEAHNAHGAVDCARLLEQSCNIGAATLAMRLGPEHFLNWCEKLGFGARTGIELANESPGSLNRANIKARITLANMGFGQSMAVTPVQMAAAYAVIANGGEWVQPHLVKGYLQDDGSLKPVTVPRRRVCQQATAKLMRGYLEQVVTKGTGNLSAISGYRVAGKTGTAQKVSGRGYGGGKAIGSFIGFMPVEKPRFVIIAVIDEPQSSHYGGVVAAPVVREVGRRALQFLAIPPSNNGGKPQVR